MCWWSTPSRSRAQAELDGEMGDSHMGYRQD